MLNVHLNRAVRPSSTRTLFPPDSSAVVDSQRLQPQVDCAGPRRGKSGSLMDVDLEHDRICTLRRAANRHDSRGLHQMLVALLLLLSLHNVMSNPHG
jgi:hypothetical protein